MTLNFLKRKKSSRPSVLLYHNIEYKESSQLPQDGPDAERKRKNWHNIPHRSQKKSKNLKKESVESYFHTKAMKHIEELLFEISESQKSSELSHNQATTIEKLLSDETDSPKQTIAACQNKPNISNPANKTKHRGSQLPLDIQELKNIAAMAKRLNSHKRS